MTGSPRRAARSIGKAQFGAEQLRSAAGADSFCAAWDRALTFAQEREAARIARNLGRLADDEVAEAESEPGWDDPGMKDGKDFIEMMVGKYCIKLAQERKHRLSGEIAAADFTLRQITYLEVALDVMSTNFIEEYAKAERSGIRLWEIADTCMSRLLDDARRMHWEANGEPVGPDRPEHLMIAPVKPDMPWDGDARYMKDDGIWGGPEAYRKAQEQEMRERHAADAIAVVKWEVEQREVVAAWARAQLAKRDAEQADAADSDSTVTPG